VNVYVAVLEEEDVDVVSLSTLVVALELEAAVSSMTREAWSVSLVMMASELVRCSKQSLKSRMREGMSEK
jgi:hypothetical protein